MNAQQQLTDEEIRSIDLSQLVGYLVGHGWSKVTTHGANGWIYGHESGSRILVPSREDVTDYVFVVWEVLKAVARVSNGDADGIYQSVRFQRHDIIRIQAVDSEADGGTISPDAAGQLYTGAKQLWEESVKSSLGDTPEAREYWRMARFGQSERGSYVVTMLSPPVFLGQEVAFGSVPDVLIPTRKVTKSLLTAIQQAKSIATDIRSGSDGGVIKKAYEWGMSVGACQALQKVVEPFESVSCRISESNIDPTVTSEPAVIQFEQQDAPILRQVTAGLKELELQRPAESTLQGYILRCERRESQDEGRITLQALMPDVTRIQTVHLQVSGEDYSRALRFHGEKQRIDAKGKLVQTAPSTWQLKDAQIRKTLSDDWSLESRAN